MAYTSMTISRVENSAQAGNTKFPGPGFALLAYVYPKTNYY